MDICYDRLKEDVLCLRGKETVALLEDFNDRFGRFVDMNIDDVIGMIGEGTYLMLVGIDWFPFLN